MDSVSLKSKSKEYPQEEHSTPQRSATSREAVVETTPLNRWDAWTEDSEDPDWMAKFRDFTGNLSDDENFDWELLDDRSMRLCSADGLDLDRYQEFIDGEGENPEAIGTVRQRYVDSHWGQLASSLLGNPVSFRGPTAGPTERFWRQHQTERYFLDLF